MDIMATRQKIHKKRYAICYKNHQRANRQITLQREREREKEHSQVMGVGITGEWGNRRHISQIRTQNTLFFFKDILSSGQRYTAAESSDGFPFIIITCGSFHFIHVIYVMLWMLCVNKSYYNSSNVCLCVCLCAPYLLWGPLTDLRQTWWVYVAGPLICPWGVLFQKGQRVDGSMDPFHFPLYYICASLTPHTCKRPLLLCCC